MDSTAREDLGNYDECLAIEHYYDKGRILGKYCYMGVWIPDIVDLANLQVRFLFGEIVIINNFSFYRFCVINKHILQLNIFSEV